MNTAYQGEISNILHMPAGREMDALVAESVMGIKVRISDGKWELCARMDYADAGELMVDNTGLFYSERIHKHSTDIAAAFEVAEKFGYYEIKRLGKRYAVYIENDDNIRTGVSQEDSLPLAICRAALLAEMEKQAALLEAA